MKTIYVKELGRKLVKAGGVNWGRVGTAFVFLTACFLFGRAAAETFSDTLQTSGEPIIRKTENWGLGFGREGEKPKGNATPEEMAKYGAYFCASGDEKVLYLTFDCGFENGNTEAILDALKKHNAPATFFVVGHYLESAPELVKRMVEDA